MVNSHDAPVRVLTAWTSTAVSVFREEMLRLGCDPSSQLLGACTLLACRGGTCVSIAHSASLLAFRWKRRHLGREGHVVQFQYFSGLDLWKTSVLCYKLLCKNHCSLPVRIQEYKECKIESFQIEKSNSASRVKISITISIPFFAFPPPAFTHSHSSKRRNDRKSTGVYRLSEGWW